MSQSKLSRIGTGRAAATMADVASLLHAYGADNETRTRLTQLARSASREYRSSRANRRRGMERKQTELAGFEDSAREMRHFLPAVPTGLLHTRAYAKATLAALGTVPPGSFDRVIDAKMARQESLANPSRRWVFLLTETAVRARVAPLDVMAAQCAHMAELAQQRENVEIALLPFAAAWPVMALNVFVVYDDRFVTCELLSGEVVLHDPQDVAYHRSLFDRFLAQALTGTDAVAFLRTAAAEYGAQHRFMRDHA